ncbi:MAG: DUF1109 family protein [Hyphomicrobiales bacterium]|nr:DUF1109 family protein [Hyphomicrobiales bacterium]MDE2115730.1 DUF1109 family protein [Hyphomicrobiales bacterium]
MTTTPDLIEDLARNLQPVRPLQKPLTRAILWLVLAMIVLGLLAISQGVRPDLWLKLQQADFSLSLAGMALTGILAACSAFMVSLPDRSRLWLALPIPSFLLWIGNIGYQCATHWVKIDANGVSSGETLRCLATLVLSSLPLSLMLLLMLRHAALLRPLQVALMGSLAVSALTAAALTTFHVLDASAIILIWNFGTTFAFVGAGWLSNRRIFNLVAPRLRSL